MNRVYVPIHIVDWTKAMTLVVKDAAFALENSLEERHDLDSWIRFSMSPKGRDYERVATSRYDLALPEIILLRDYDRLPDRDVKYTRNSVFKRDGFRCGYCLQSFRREELTIDHIIPQCVGGPNTWDNTVSCCQPCNARKADRTPKQAGMPLRIQPKEPRWSSPLANLREDSPKSWHMFWNKA